MFKNKQLLLILHVWNDNAETRDIFLDFLVCGMKCTGREEHHIEIRVLQPTMSSTRMVVGDILSGIFILDTVILKLAMIIANLSKKGKLRQYNEMIYKNL